MGLTNIFLEFSEFPELAELKLGGNELPFPESVVLPFGKPAPLFQAFLRTRKEPKERVPGLATENPVTDLIRALSLDADCPFESLPPATRESYLVLEFSKALGLGALDKFVRLCGWNQLRRGELCHGFAKIGALRHLQLTQELEKLFTPVSIEAYTESGKTGDRRVDGKLDEIYENARSGSSHLGRENIEELHKRWTTERAELVLLDGADSDNLLARIQELEGKRNLPDKPTDILFRIEGALTQKIDGERFKKCLKWINQELKAHDRSGVVRLSGMRKEAALSILLSEPLELLRRDACDHINAFYQGEKVVTGVGFKTLEVPGNLESGWEAVLGESPFDGVVVVYRLHGLDVLERTLVG